MVMHRIESLLSARLFVRPQLVNQRIFFESNLSGHISLYAMNYGGSVPEPLLPPEIALHNPHLLTGKSYYVYPKLNKILVMVDNNGDERYQPMTIPLDGGYPQLAFGNIFSDFRVFMDRCDPDNNSAYFVANSLSEQRVLTYQGNLETGEANLIGESPWGLYPEGVNTDHSKVVLLETYSHGDHVVFLWDIHANQMKVLYGTPIQERSLDQSVPLNEIMNTCFTDNDRGLMFITALFDDQRGLGYLDLKKEDDVVPIAIHGIQHQGIGELTQLEHIQENRYLITYNINGCSWLYECRFDENQRLMQIEHRICGEGTLSDGVLESIYFDKVSNQYSLAFSTATSPTQIYTVEGLQREIIRRHTNERVLGINPEILAPGEDASYTSFDGMYIPARLYLPDSSLGFTGVRPVIFYIHGGPQSQERPDFAWFSIPLIQFLTLKGFAVFVPNVRGSEGYGLHFTKQVDLDWGGKDRLDHVHALTKVLPNDHRLDVSRAGVVGRSYGGYMTLSLAGRHPELWSAAVDMFGPYDLITFSERIPETWKPYFKLVIGDPDDESGRMFLAERSPRTYLDNLSCPMLVIQGKNDPRVVERESSDLITDLRAKGKEIDYIVFENEGHDVLKFENRVLCYNAITEFFAKYLLP